MTYKNLLYIRTTRPIYDEENDAEDMESDIENIDEMNEIIDSEEEYTEAEKKLLENARNKNTIENYDSEEEVYGLQHSEEEEEEDDQSDSMASDIGVLQEDDDMPDDSNWGNKESTYYSSDFKYLNYGYSIIPEKDEINANIENEEGKRIQTGSKNFLHKRATDFSLLINKEDNKEIADKYRQEEQVSTEEREDQFFMNVINKFKSMSKI